jgi:hypothetical protein
VQQPTGPGTRSVPGVRVVGFGGDDHGEAPFSDLLPTDLEGLR